MTKTGAEPIKITTQQKELITAAIKKGDVDEIIGLYNKAGWNINKQALNKVPEHIKKAGGKPSKYMMKYDNADSVGIRYVELDHDQVRIMQGKPDGKPSQQQDYVKIVSGGKMRDKFGDIVKEGDNGFKRPGDNPRSHISVNDWLIWKEWNKP